MLALEKVPTGQGMQVRSLDTVAVLLTKLPGRHCVRFMQAGAFWVAVKLTPSTHARQTRSVVAVGPLTIRVPAKHVCAAWHLSQHGCEFVNVLAAHARHRVDLLAFSE